MDFFQNNSFNSPVSDFPLNLTLGEWLNVALTLENVDSNLKLVVPDCLATPTSQETDPTNYPLFEDKCQHDPTLGFFPLNSTSFGYRYQTFKFVNFDQVFLHCKASFVWCPRKAPNVTEAVTRRLTQPRHHQAQAPRGHCKDIVYKTDISHSESAVELQ